MKKGILSFMFYLINAFGISLTIKASVGVSSFNSFNVVVSEMSTLQVGTVTTLMNLCFLAGGLIFDSKRTIKGYLLMLLALTCFGEAINLMLYVVLSHFVLDNYLLQLLMFISGTIIAGYGTGKVLQLNLLKFPIEHFCQLIAEKTAKPFKFYRYAVDIVCVSFSLVFSLSLSLPVAVREGTIISLFLLSGVISWSKNKPL